MESEVYAVKGSIVLDPDLKNWTKGPIPHNDEERVKALLDLEILDTGSEPDFDKITSLCNRLFGTDLSTITLVDKDRLYYKSQCPFQIREFPRTGFCSRTVYENKTLIVLDAQKDEMFKDDEVTKTFGIRFYAGVPLKTPEDYAIGVLCILSNHPRDSFSDEDKRNLEDLAIVTMQAIQLRLANSKQREKVAKQKELVEELEDDKKMLLMGLNTFPEGLFLWNSQSNSVTFVNDAFQKLTGYSRSEIENHIGDPSPFWIGSDASDHTKELLKDMFQNPRDLAIEFEGRTREGEKRWMSVHMAPTDDTNKIHCFGVLSDITQRKENELELQKTQRAAQQATEAKNAFLANMSHEIRTPLNAICASSELILESKQNGEQKELTHMINSSAHTLLALVNDILDFSKIEANVVDLNLTRFELRTCIENCIDMLYIRAAHKGLTLNYNIQSEVPTSLHLDEPRLRQILTNLLNNAVTFTQKGEVELTVSMKTPMKRSSSATDTDQMNLSKEESAEEGEMIQFSVRDTGIGIKESLVNRLFQLFSQLDDSRTRKYGGTGLGLAISQRLTRAMGGQMFVESVYGEGSTFGFTIPCPKGSGNKRHSSISSLESKQIMVVAKDSNERMISSLLRSLKTHVKSCPTLEEAKTLSASFAFDCLVLGPNLQSREDNPIPGIPTVHLIRRNEVEDHSCAFSENRNILTYPIHQASFKKLLEDIFSQQRGQNNIKVRRTSEANSPVVQHVEPNAQPAPKACNELDILIAEDNKFNQRVLIKILETLGYKPEVVENGKEVLQALDRKNFDVVLMDLQMPEMDGLEASRIIQTRKVNNKPDIIAITADVLKGIEDKCREAGMQGYLAKPVKKQQIAETLEKLCLPPGEREDWIVFH